MVNKTQLGRQAPQVGVDQPPVGDRLLQHPALVPAEGPLHQKQPAADNSRIGLPQRQHLHADDALYCANWNCANCKKNRLWLPQLQQPSLPRCHQMNRNEPDTKHYYYYYHL
ncbi:hypothetical protein TYRP_002984 [Tyrophagus putrescentiae]|nr:hypothetical protein TYRP_002984 [Tyrophagus putrescentiae]